MEHFKKGKDKLLVIGIDGGTFDIILPMIHAGKLPNLGGILSDGAYGTLLSTIPPVTAPAWSSFVMGSNPGQHGVFYFFRKEEKNNGANSQRVLMNLRNIKGIPFWRVLNRYGNKVGLINIPLTYPPEKVDGFMISGMLVPPGADDYTYPPELFSTLDKYYVDVDGLMKQGEWQGKKLIRENSEQFIKNVFQITSNRAHNALTLMKKEPWDFFMVVFTGSDRVCHFFWEDRKTGKSPSSVIEDYYIHLDSIIGKLFDEAGDDTCKIIMSDHGFGPAPAKRINVFTLANDLGETVFLPGHTFSYLKARLLGKIGIPKRIDPEDLIDLKRSRVLLEPMYANFLGVSINIKDEAGNGAVAPGREYQHLREKVINYLERLRDPVSGKCLVEKVHTRESLYHGKSANNAPDLVVQFSYDIKTGFSPLKKALVRRAKDPVRTGDHRREGIFMASGRHIQAGGIQKDLLIQDVTPTLLYLSGCPIPESYDGRLIKELFSDEYLAQNPPEYYDDSKKPDSPSSGEQGFDSEKEYEQARTLLENLGYM